MYGHIEGQSLIDMNDETLNKKESLALELLKVADAVSPSKFSFRFQKREIINNNYVVL